MTLDLVAGVVCAVLAALAVVRAREAGRHG